MGIPAVGLTPTSKGLYLSSRGNEQLHQKNQNGGNDVTHNNAANSQSDEQLNTDNNHTNSFSENTTESHSKTYLYIGEGLPTFLLLKILHIFK